MLRLPRLLRPALAAAAGALALCGAAAGTALADPAPVVVSLEFDDGTADHARAAEILDARGLDATFFINSSRPGQTGFLGWGEVAALAAAGHEIGGHTLTHENLPAIPTAEQQREVCDDRAALLARGYDVRSFAFPFGATSDAAAGVVRDCGYNSGRKVSGIASAGGCSGCAAAETIPPADPYRTRIPQSVRPTTTLADLQGYVDAARAGGGGWIQIVMHRICDGCSEFAISEPLLGALADWLAAQQALGALEVRTVGAVIGGPTRPAVPGPPRPSPVTRANGLANPSLESDADADGTADCWTHAVFGSSTATWSRSPEAAAGAWAERIDVHSLSSGARRLLVRQDQGTCSPTVRPGHRYEVAAAHRGSATPRFVVYRRLTQGAWTYWTQSGDQPSGPEWRRSSWTTPPVPPDTTALSVGLSVAAPGWLAMDDLSLRDADDLPPSVTLTAPAADLRTDGALDLAAEAADDSGIDAVEFLVDGEVLARRTAAPYAATLDEAVSAERTVTVRARATDTAGNVALSAPRTVTLVPPDVTAPVSSATCDGGPCAPGWLPAPVTVTLEADDAGGTGVAELRYSLDGSAPGPESGERYSGPFELRETTELAWLAIDRRGNPEGVRRETVRVDSAAPSVGLTCDPAPCSEAWTAAPVTLSLEAADADSGLAELRYTTDGTAPTRQSGLSYDGPVTLAASAAIRARAWDHAGNASPVLGHEVRIDAVAPRTSASCGSSACPAGPVPVRQPVVVSLAAADDASGVEELLVRVDGAAGPGAWQLYAGPLTISDPATVRYRATDRAGNAEAEQALGLAVDTRAPAVTLDEPAPGSLVSGETYLRAVPADDQSVARVRFLLDGRQLGSRIAAPWRWKWDTRTAADGPHSVRVVAEDAAGNTTSSADVPLTVLNAAPQVSVSLDEPLPGAIVGGPGVYIRATPSAALGVARVRFFLDGVQLGSRVTAPWRWKWDTRPAANGPHVLRVTAEDALGRSASSASVTVAVANP